MAIPVYSRDYFEASRERMNQAGQPYRSQQYSIAMYLAGVAVECMLRAFHFDRGSTTDTTLN